MKKKVKLLPRRLSKIIVLESALKKVQEAIAMLDVCIGDDTQISDDDYASLRKIADKLKLQCDDVFDIVRVSPDFVETPLSIEDMDKDKLFYEFCDKVRAALNSFMIKLDREQNIAGAQYFNACTVFESDIDGKIQRGNNAKAQNIQAQLDGVNRKRGGGKKVDDPSAGGDNPPKEGSSSK
jgi:hypothetical protein